MKKKKAKIKVRKARILKIEPHPAKPDTVIVQAANAEFEIENAPLPPEPLIDPIQFDADVATELPEEALTPWQRFWRELWS